jgi:hypothetical protein
LDSASDDMAREKQRRAVFIQLLQDRPHNTHKQTRDFSTLKNTAQKR